MRKKRFVPWMFLAPSFAGVICFTGIPFLDVIRRSFRDAMGRQFMGWENYRSVLENAAFRLAVKNTAWFLAAVIPLLMAVSFAVALLVWAGMGRNGEGWKGVSVFRTTLVLPMAVPAASMVLVWKILFCPEGVLNQALTGMTGRVWEVDWAYSSWSFPLLAATYLWKHVGYDMVLWLAGLQGISHELYEAARMDGAGEFARLWYVTLPGLRGSFRLVGILSLVDAFRVYREAYLLAGAYPDDSIYLLPHLFAHWFLQMDIQKMTAAAMMLTGSFLLPVLVWRLIAVYRQRIL